MSDQPVPLGFTFIGPAPELEPDVFRPFGVNRDDWGVWLTGQGNEWLIAAESDRNFVLAELDRFIADAAAIRRKLADPDFDPCPRCGHDLQRDHRYHPDGPDGSLSVVECLGCGRWENTD